jgi:hypothetical protein
MCGLAPCVASTAEAIRSADRLGRISELRLLDTAISNNHLRCADEIIEARIAELKKGGA